MPFQATKSTATKKHDPIQAILSSVGVSYTHENSEVIGSSKVEALLSRRAEEAATSKDRWGTQEQQSKAFLEEPLMQSSHDVKREGRPDREDGATTVATATNNLGSVRYRYRPTQAVKKRQFGSMARWAGYGADVVSFALVVENWTQAERRECLDRFYQFRRDLLSGGGGGPLKGEVVTDEGDVKLEGDVAVKSERELATTHPRVVASRPAGDDGHDDDVTPAVKAEKVDLRDHVDVDTASDDDPDDDEL